MSCEIVSWTAGSRQQNTSSCYRALCWPPFCNYHRFTKMSPTLEEVYHVNEAFRATVNSSGSGWISQAEIQGSVFNYGVGSTLC